MLARLILLFTLVPFLELALLLWLGSKMGWLPTVALILVTGVLGASLARLQGLATWRRFQVALQAGRLPGRELAEGVMILVAGAVLLTPGILTDAVGFALLVPRLRRALADRLSAWARRRARIVPGGSGPSSVGRRPAPSSDAGDSDVVDADYVVLDDRS